MGRDDDFETAGLLYDAALGHLDWADVGARFVSMVDGATLTFSAQHGQTGSVDLIAMLGVTAKEVNLYAKHYVADDLWINTSLSRRLLNRAIASGDLVSELEWQNSRIYTELCRPNTDIFHGIVVTGTLPENGLYAMGVHRPRRAKPFGPVAIDRLNRMAPHIRRALHMRSKLGTTHVDANTSSAVLDNFSFGIVQLTAAGRLVRANCAAQQILDAHDGLSLTRAGLRAASGLDDAQLHHAIAGAPDLLRVRGSNGHLRISRPSGRRPYVIIVAPLGLDRMLLSPRQPAVLLIITDPEDVPRLDERALIALFGFTPAEARVVALLVIGRSLPEAAKELRINFETARTHLARARGKTDTASQVDLVRTVLVALSPLARGGP